VRDLTTPEILEQYFLQGVLTGRFPDHVVFMGMGEPFFNAEAVYGAIDVLLAPWGGGLSARHVTVSTSGVVPGILEFAKRGGQVRLSVSLHAADDAVRDVLVPINRKWPLCALAEAIRTYQEAARRQVTFEYVLLEGVNADLSDAKALARWVRPFRCSVNLIPYNAVEEFPHRPPSRDNARAFADALREAGVRTTIRLRRGNDIAGACGQLRLRQETAP
jgi:23S rRNA (adenine2503-C2)-methyltransferase